MSGMFYRKWQRKTTAIVLSLLILSSSAFVSGCSCNIASSSIDKATEVIDNGIRDITQNSEAWQSILQRIANDLPQDISETIRVDAQSLATRAIATTGVEFRCNVDFLANRAIQALKRLKAMLLNQNPPPLPPAFCQVDPSSIDLKVSPDHWSTVILYGYDFDHTDTSGAKFKIMLIDNQGHTSYLPEDRIGRTTHYQVTLNLGNMARDLYVRKITKLIVSWGGKTEGYPQIVVIPWEARSKTLTAVSIGSTGPYTPPHVGSGDLDFYTKNDRPTTVEVRGEINIQLTRILNRVTMHAREDHSDYTEVNGISPWAVAYQAPEGWQISDVTPRDNSIHNASVTVHGRLVFNRPGGEIVDYFEVWVDQDGDDAGTYTKVTAHWRPLNITLPEIMPVWLQ